MLAFADDQDEFSINLNSVFWPKTEVQFSFEKLDSKLSKARVSHLHRASSRMRRGHFGRIPWQRGKRYL